MKKILLFTIFFGIAFQGTILSGILEITDVQMAVVTDPVDATSYRILIKANAPGLPPDTTIERIRYELNIDYAVLQLTGTVIQIPSEKLYLEALILTTPWNKDNPSWEASNKVDEDYKVTDLFTLQTENITELSLDVTELSRAWLLEKKPNHGHVLRSPEMLPSLLNSSIVTFTPAQQKAKLLIYFTYNPKS